VVVVQRVKISAVLIPQGLRLIFSVIHMQVRNTFQGKFNFLLLLLLGFYKIIYNFRAFKLYGLYNPYNLKKDFTAGAMQ
jgi:hypothetical protein